MIYSLTKNDSMFPTTPIGTRAKKYDLFMALPENKIPIY